MHDQEPAIGAGAAHLLTKLCGGEAADPVSTELDQPLGLLSQRRKGVQCRWYAATSGQGSARPWYNAAPCSPGSAAVIAAAYPFLSGWPLGSLAGCGWA